LKKKAAFFVSTLLPCGYAAGSFAIPALEQHKVTGFKLVDKP
jgi:hypothetical protein